MLFCYITAVPKSTRFSTRLKTPAKTKITINPQVNTTYEVYNFRKAQQNEGESFDSFHTRLRTLAKTCEFADADEKIKEQTILSCKSNALGRKALREDLDLTALLKAGRALELSETQAKELESDKTTVNVVNDKKKSEKVADESHAAGHTRSHASPMRQQNAEIVAAAILTRTPALLEIRSAPPVASLIILLKFAGQFHPIQ